jgi:hypothetical protein
MAALLVIDTQSLLDWLVFHDPVCAGWPERLGGPWQWIYTAPMRAEFDVVLDRGFGPRWPVAPETDAAAVRAWARYGRLFEPPAPPGAAGRLHCSDPDDQKFIDLAIAAGVHTLVTRDKALLKLGRRAAERHGLRICTPVAWGASSTSRGPEASPHS